MRAALKTVVLAGALCLTGPAIGEVSTAPLEAINAYIEKDGRCLESLVDWNRKYFPRTVAGTSPRTFYYRVLAFSDWGACGRPWFKPLFSELQKTWLIHATGRVSDALAEAKETELVNLFFAALSSGDGEALVERYESRTTTRLMNLVPERQFFNCTFFGDRAYCTD